ncbi:replication initiation factor domain-containing protein [Enterococcus faecium]|nr:replication initiation factor domain-containing protein [Enterococcus faecium]EGP5366372.1 replication initiation protein [Enterococcus faecium]NTQ55435.1 replication initiation factor domain-containing protein [Enterococcus faecium]
MATQNKLHALIDWLQIQVLNKNRLKEVVEDLLEMRFDYFVERKGKLTYYDYNMLIEYANIRIYYRSENGKESEDGDCMIVVDGTGMTFLRERFLQEREIGLKKFLNQVFSKEHWRLKITRVDPAIDDFNEVPYFTPNQLVKICEKKQFFYGKSTTYDVYGQENKEKGMTLYLKPPGADDRIKIYDKQAERAKAQGVRKKDMPPWIRVEIVFRREKAQKFVEYYLSSEIELIDLIKGYLKEKVKFFSDAQMRQPLRKWERFLGKTVPFSLTTPKMNSELTQKFNWYFYQGAYPVYHAYLYCLKNKLLNEKELEEFERLMTIHETQEIFPPQLASELIKRVTEKGRTELIPEIKQLTKSSKEKEEK